MDLLNNCKLLITNTMLNGIVCEQTKPCKRGTNCSKSGSEYEKRIHDIVTNTTINGKRFNTQKQCQLGGSSSRIDMMCNYKKDNNIGIEIKKSTTPDWCQCSITFDIERKIWKASNKGTLLEQSRNIFNEILQEYELFGGDTPPFMTEQMTYTEWTEIKANTNKWDDEYLDIPNDTISKLYKQKGCQYIQISDYGLYHFGNDICGFGVPEFNIEQEMRIRMKIHKRTTKNGFCILSVTASCKPKKIRKLNKSQYSLDSIDTLPTVLKYSI